jgi:hypothetical protein
MIKSKNKIGDKNTKNKYWYWFELKFHTHNPIMRLRLLQKIINEAQL